jgi:hypothetical protein
MQRYACERLRISQVEFGGILTQNKHYVNDLAALPAVPLVQRSRLANTRLRHTDTGEPENCGQTQ